ncbi:MspA family porin [Nocardia sp. NPDC051030]|uniref:MspA family porin n=1 Tax=Nocardia sp. NPDC051030 TaxID=3155162 RepID=UPI003424C24B
MRLNPFGAVLLSVGAALCGGLPSARADIITLAAHEQTYESLFGSFTVGSRGELVNRIAPLNQMGTTREALVSTIAYSRINGTAGGQMKVGYHVGCAVNIGAGTLGFNPNPAVTLPGAGTPPVPSVTFNPNFIATINLNPGEVKELAVADKDVAPNITASIVIRDFHIVVNQCTGPVTIRQYTYLYAKSAEVDDSGAVFGDPTWL